MFEVEGGGMEEFVQWLSICFLIIGNTKYFSVPSQAIALFFSVMLGSHSNPSSLSGTQPELFRAATQADSLPVQIIST